MKKVRSLLCTCCLFGIAIFVMGVPLASAKGNKGNKGKICICHRPPGNPENAQEICVGMAALPAHLRHFDTIGECPVNCGGASGNTCASGQFCKRESGLCSEEDKGVCVAVPQTCPTTPDPVCGCNGTTYDNACLADAAGVSVQHPGACSEACGGSTGATCGTGQFCKHEEGACTADATGVCTDIPVECPPDLAPVCGCDGATYSNSCFADVAGIAVQHTGPCEPGSACGGTAGGTCAEGEFCKPPLGLCEAGAPGACAPLPPVCPETPDPVCGCNGTTYDNSCLADAAGVGVAHTGPCESLACGGSEQATCAAGDFCSKPVGACEADAAGVCKDIPQACPAILDLTCGCDGVTYSSPCVVEAAGITIANDGPCLPSLACGGETGVTCPEIAFCKRPTGTCDANAAGTCALKPGVCPAIQDEVCGCDGKSYANACFAAGAGVTVSHTGACPPPPQP